MPAPLTPAAPPTPRPAPGLLSSAGKSLQLDLLPSAKRNALLFAANPSNSERFFFKLVSSVSRAGSTGKGREEAFPDQPR